MHTRRTFLAGAGLLPLAGCLTTPGSDTETQTDTLPDGGNGSGETRPEGGPGVTIVDVDDAPAIPLRVDVEVTESVATDEHPPGLSVSVTNEGDQRVAVGEARAAVFAYQYSDGGFLALLPAGEEYPAEPGCWRLTEGVGTTEEYRTVALDPGASHTADLELYATGIEEDACLPVGEHRFETTITRFEDPEDLGGSQTAVDWGFTVLLE